MSLNHGGTIAGGAITGGTTILGAVSIEWSHDGQVAEGYSDGQIGPTSVDIRGWNTRGQIVVDDIQVATALEDLSPNDSLAFTFYEQNGTVKAGRFTLTSLGQVSEIEYPAGDSTGPTTRYSIDFEAVYGTADVKPADNLTFA